MLTSGGVHELTQESIAICLKASSDVQRLF